MLAIGDLPSAQVSVERGVAWLRANQNGDGGWGAALDQSPSTIEETALALSALAFLQNSNAPSLHHSPALARGLDWLVHATKNGASFEPSPIGFYFAKLWYYEKAYPIVWTVEALSRLTLTAESAGEECDPNFLRSRAAG